MDSFLVFGTIRLACLLYVLALAAWLKERLDLVPPFWTGGAALYLAHVIAAFSIRYAWSQTAAFEETARQTEALFGVRSGSGLYWNYVFTVVWLADAVWMVARPATYWSRPAWISRAVHGFMGFMFVNAVIVFPTGWIRWAGLAVLLGLAVLWRSRVNLSRRVSSSQV